MPDPLSYLKAMGVAAFVSTLIVLAIAARRRPTNSMRLNWACLFGIGLGLLAGIYQLSLRLAWPPANGLDRLLTIVIPAAWGIEAIALFHSIPHRVVWILRMSLAAMAPRILLHGSTYLSGPEWSPWQAYAALVVPGTLLAGGWVLLSWLSQRSPGTSIPVSLCLAMQCAGLTVMLAGYIKGGAAAFPLFAAVLATTISARLVTKHPDTPANFVVPAIVGIGVVGLFGLLFVGDFFGRLSTSFALTIFLAPLMCWATEVPILRRGKPWQVESLRLALVAIPLIIVLAVAKADFDRDMAPLLGTAEAKPISASMGG